MQPIELPSRKPTRAVKVGDVIIGGGFPIAIQSMTNTKTSDPQATLSQIERLAQAGCQIVRVSVPDEDSARALPAILSKSPLPIVADIHFDYRLALLAVQGGVSGLRINPGNIGEEDRIAQVVKAAKKASIKIRIGVNAGSLEKDIQAQYGNGPQAMVESALRHVRILEKYDFEQIVVSVKSSNVPATVLANRLLSEKLSYPLHLGITEAGTLLSGSVRSAVGLGALLLEGIGDTIRVSLTDDPVKEIQAAQEILRSTGHPASGVQIISCPTCARTDIDIIGLAKKIEEELHGIKKTIRVAVMGCAVNGPGEARGADLGIAGGKGEALLFRKGEILYKVKEEEIIPALLREIDRLPEEEA